MDTKKIMKDAKSVLYNNIYVEDEHLATTNRTLFTAHRVIVPSNPYYYGFWNWDGAFHMIGAALHGDKELAKDQAKALFSLQFGDGMFIDCARVDGSRVTEFSKPPVWPWAFRVANEFLEFENEFLEESFSRLEANIEWWERERFDGTLFSYKVHPYESGMDDSPRFDEPFDIENLWAVDANGFMYSAYKNMAYIAKEIKNIVAAHAYEEKAEQLKMKINELLFCEKLGCYCDFDKKSQTFTGHLSPMSFIPLFAGCADEEKALKMKEIAQNPEMFFDGMPTISYDNPCFEAALFWRGPCWLNTAYFAIRGLANYGFLELSLTYCKRILSWIEDCGFWEYYDTKRNCGIGQENFGWSSVFGALFVLLYRELGGEDTIS